MTNKKQLKFKAGDTAYHNDWNPVTIGKARRSSLYRQTYFYARPEGAWADGTTRGRYIRSDYLFA